MNTNKILYWLFTIAMCGIFALSATMYLTKYDMVVGFFEHMGFPIWLIYPMAVAKILGILTILIKPSKLLKEWTYAGFFFNAVLATGAHHFSGDGILQMSTAAIFLVLLSRYYDGKLFS